MTADLEPAPPAPSWQLGGNPLVFEWLARPEVNLALWERELPHELEAELRTWVAGHAAHYERTLEATYEAMRAGLAIATEGLAEPTRTWLCWDAGSLLDRFVQLTGARKLRLSLGAVRNDQCRKFHVDYLRYRMITTYAGPGTEWLPDEAVHREALAAPPSAAEEANRQVLRDAAGVRHARAGDVLILKGARHEHARGAVHRSPPIEGSYAARVVLIASTLEPRPAR